MKKTLILLPVVLLVLILTACSQSDVAVKTNNSEVLVSYAEIDTGTLLSDDLTLTKTGESLSFSPSEYNKEIEGYRFLFSTTDKIVAVKQGQQLEVTYYYIKNESVTADSAVLITRFFATDTGEEIATPKALVQKDAITVTLTSIAGTVDGYRYMMADLTDQTVVASGKTITANLYYKKGAASGDSVAAVMVRYTDFGNDTPLARPVVITGSSALTVKKDEYKSEFTGYQYMKASADEVSVAPGTTGVLTHYYRSASAANTATVTVSHLEAGTENKLMDDEVLTQTGANLFVEAAPHVKQVSGFSYASASADNVTAFPGENISLKIYYTAVPTGKVATVVFNYYQEGTNKQISSSQEVKNDGAALTVTTSKYVKAITGYVYVSTNPSGSVSANPGQTIQIAMYYRVNSPSSGGTSTVIQPAPAALYPTAPGTAVLDTDKGHIDYSNSSEGYFYARFSGDPTKRSKLQVIKDGATITYDLDSAGSSSVIPFNLGSGSYKIVIYEQTTGSSYATALSTTVSVSLRNSLVPYLYPNRIVNYTAGSAAVTKARALCTGAANDLQRLKAIYAYIIANVKYDYAKASSVQSGYIPNVDSTLSTNKGICYDYAALMAAMLRSQGIPTRLVMGYVAPSGAYHAWNEVYLQNAGWITVAIYADGNTYKLLDSTFDATMSDADTAKFITTAGNYTVASRY